MTEPTINPKLAASEVVSFLEKEVVRIKKKTKKNLSIGFMLIGVVAGYLFWLYSIVKNEFLNPERLSQVIVGLAEEHIPDYLGQLENSLIASAPQAGKDVVIKIKSLFPAFRLMVQSEFEESMKLLPVLDGELQEGIKSYIRTHQEEIVALYDAHDDNEFAEQALNATLEQIGEELSVSGNGLPEFGMKSMELLKKIDQQLAVLETKNPSNLSNIEKQKIKLIAAVFEGIEKYK